MHVAYTRVRMEMIIISSSVCSWCSSFCFARPTSDGKASSVRSHAFNGGESLDWIKVLFPLPPAAAPLCVCMCAAVSAASPSSVLAVVLLLLLVCPAHAAATTQRPRPLGSGKGILSRRRRRRESAAKAKRVRVCCVLRQHQSNAQLLTQTHTGPVKEAF